MAIAAAFNKMTNVKNLYLASNDWSMAGWGRRVSNGNLHMWDETRCF